MVDKKKCQIGNLLCDKKSEISFNSGNYFSFIFITSGTASFSHEERLFRCGVHHLIFVNTKSRIHLKRINKTIPLEINWIKFSSRLLDELSDKCTNLRFVLENTMGSCEVIYADCTMLTISKNIVHSIKNQDNLPAAFGDKIYENGLLSSLIILLIRICQVSDPLSTDGSARAFHVDALFAYINQHISEDLSLSQLEKKFYVSKNYMSREFRQKTGQTIHAYILKVRLSLSQKYIMEGFSVKEICERTGFGSYNHFFRAFKLEFGMTPKEYRINAIKNYDSDSLLSIPD